MARILCAWSPAWAIANWRRRNPSASPAEPSDGAFALVATDRGVRRLAAVDETAVGLGLFVGQKATDAAALVPGLATAEADPAADQAALEALCDWCARFSPAVALAAPDGLFLDITGVAHLWGGEGALLADLTARLGKGGIPVRAAAAPTAGAAWALAHFGPAGARVGPDEVMARLAPLPVTALRLEEATAAQLARLGLTTVGRLAGTPRDQLTRRFGREPATRLDQALGRGEEALAFRRPSNPWFARLAFAEPISTPDDLARASGEAVARLCARLEAEGRGAARFELGFHRLDGVAQPLRLGLSLPGRDAGRIARLFAPRLEEVDPGFGIEVVTATCEEVQPLAPRQGALEADARDPPEEALAPLVDRLATRLGAEAVWRAEPFPSHAPERAAVRRPPLSPPGADGAGWDLRRPRPLRLLGRPEPIEAIAPVPDDPPVFFRWRGAPHRVRRAEGPERLAREWWRAPFETASDPVLVRDYYRVEDEEGGRFWLFRAGLHAAGAPAKWWLHGLFG